MLFRSTSTTVNSGGYLYVYDGGTATATTVNGYFDWGYYCDGRLYVSSGGTATSTTVNSGGSLWVSSGGSAVRTTVNSDGSLVVFSGGTVASATVNNGGALTVDSGGKALAIKENGGYVSVGSGTVVSFIPTALSGMILTDQATLHSGTTASDTTVSGGALFVYDGGVAGNTTFAEGMLYLYQGALHKGTLTFESNYPGITTVMGYGGTVDFTVSERKTTDDYLINNLSYSGNLNFTITVSENQEQGTYKLAQKATYLTAFIMLENGDNCGTISVNQTLKYNETIYSLDLSAAGDLTLTISKEEQSGVLLTSSGSVVSSGTVLSNVLIGSNMKAEIFESGAQICNATITRGGVMYVSNGGAAVDADVTQGGKIFLCSGGSASGTVLKGTLNADAYSYLFDTVIENGGVAYILNMAQADMITVKQNGNLYVGMAGEASGITLENGALHVATGGRVYDVRVDSGSQLFLYGGAILDGVINVNGTVTLDDLAVNNGRVNFVLAQKQNSAPMVNDLAFLSGGDLSVSVDNASEGLYLLAQNAAEFDGEFAVMSDESSVGSLGVGDNIFVGNKEFLLLENSGNLHIQCYNASDVYALSRNENAISWRGLPTDTPKYIVEYSRTNGAGKLQFNTATKGVDTFSFDSGSFQWRVSADGKLWAEGDSFNVEQSTPAQVLLSQANGNMDLFFATPDGVWEAGYAACHVGYGQWEGTGEAVSLDGKNRITHIFEGSSDANLLVLTDDAQGDVLFTDDMFSALPGSVAEQQSRLSQINEIRAGSGDDIIDLTSQRFAWSGDGLTVCGGDGDDVIWANANSNILFGDAGNDRITGGNDNDIIAGGSGNDQLHGGGGEDTFTFGSNWGNDQITQLENGSVTLWLAEGSMEHWNAETLTYSDGENTITVSGCADINFKFGVNPEDDERFFAESTTCRIFE